MTNKILTYTLAVGGLLFIIAGIIKLLSDG